MEKSRLFNHKEAIRSIINRYKIWRTGLKWYIISIFLIIFISLLSVMIHIIFFESPLKEGHALFDMYQDMVMLILTLFITVFVTYKFIYSKLVPFHSSESFSDN